MSWHYDPFKPMSEKTPADWATDYMIYEEVTKDWDSGSGDGGFSKPPKKPKKKNPNPGETEGCAKAIVFAVVLLLGMVGIGFLADSCMLSLHRQSDEERQSSMVASRVSEYEATRNATTQPTTEETYTTRRYTTQKYTTRDDPFDAYGYLDADDFAAENYEEFDDYDEAYDYYEDYMAGYD